MHIFNPTFATNGLKGVLGKYAQAAQFLAGIGLNPSTHPASGYAPFNPTAPNATNAPFLILTNTTALSADTSEDTATGILELPGTAELPLTDYVTDGLDVLYYGSLTFGSGAQPLTVDIDTGSADLWVPVECRTCAGEQFREWESNSYQSLGRRFSVTYGEGRVSGTLVQDRVAAGGLVVPTQAFLAVSSESYDFADEPSAGLLGLAFGSIARSKRPTLFENLLSDKQIPVGAFAVHLERGQASGSEVCFGCYDATKTTGTVRWNPLISQTYWSILMDGVSPISGQSISTNLTAAIDTGTSLIYVPDDVADQFYALIPGSQSTTEFGAGFYTFPCASALDISLSFSGNSFSVNMLDFNLGRTTAGSPDCVGGILALGSDFPSDLAIVGDEFLKSWYSVFDYAGLRVGFAPSINNK
ncbi:Aspartic protease [Sparassis crispa]|uniref:Aspartic protease n=1 Tax=Sparassis crispa TaxID=139825 RepID=A0A401GF21_9APHY|nr:Aspartic protease [Sparassis crispa]GBE80703.1 Aspartic protease [Sparassis crispa]